MTTDAVSLRPDNADDGRTPLDGADVELTGKRAEAVGTSHDSSTNRSGRRPPKTSSEVSAMEKDT